MNLFSWRKQGEFGVKRKKNFQAIQSCHVLLTRILTPPAKREQKRTIRGDNNGPSPPPCVDKIVNVFSRWILRQNFVSCAPTVKTRGWSTPPSFDQISLNLEWSTVVWVGLNSNWVWLMKSLVSELGLKCETSWKELSYVLSKNVVARVPVRFYFF